MKIKDKFQNYTPALMYFIADNHPVFGSNDSRLYAYYIPLASFKRGFDFYELKSHKNGGFYFSISTMLGFKLILQTDSELIYSDLSEDKWKEIIGRISTTHLMRQEYQALKKGYVKKGQGCFGTVLLTFLFGILLFNLFI